MRKKSLNTLILADGTRVKYTLTMRHPDPFWMVRFRLPDGRRTWRSTGKTTIEAADLQVPSIIGGVYRPDEQPAKRLTWAEATEKAVNAMKGHNLRPRTIGDYLEAVASLRKVFPGLQGPADVTDTLAKQFKAKRMEKGISPFTVAADLRALSSLWSKWFVGELEILPGNPWEDVDPPKTDKKTKRILSDAEEAEFLEWIKGRFGGWKLPWLFVVTKLCIGCRVSELAGLESAWLKDGRIHFPEDTTKGREARQCRIPAWLFTELEKLAGPSYLWEGYVEGLRAYFLAKGGRSNRHAQNLLGFTPDRMVGFMQDTTQEYQKLKAAKVVGWKKFTLHNCRGTAMNRYLEASGGDFQRGSIAFDCHTDTMKTYYVELERTAIADGVFDTVQKRYQK